MFDQEARATHLSTPTRARHGGESGRDARAPKLRRLPIAR